MIFNQTLQDGPLPVLSPEIIGEKGTVEVITSKKYGFGFPWLEGIEKT